MWIVLFVVDNRTQYLGFWGVTTLFDEAQIFESEERATLEAEEIYTVWPQAKVRIIRVEWGFSPQAGTKPPHN